jgi:hypothetical protein
MEKKTGSSGELITWYLARLRSNARQSSLERKLTPLTLVKTDKTLIQDIVMHAHIDHEQRSADILKTLKEKNNGIRNAQNVLVLLAVLGTLFLISLALF